MKPKLDQYQYISTANLPTHWGKFHIHGFIDNELEQEHVANRFRFERLAVSWHPSSNSPTVYAHVARY